MFSCDIFGKVASKNPTKNLEKCFSSLFFCREEHAVFRRVPVKWISFPLEEITSPLELREGTSRLLKFWLTPLVVVEKVLLLQKKIQFSEEESLNL